MSLRGRLLGPSSKELWRQLSEQLGPEFLIRQADFMSGLLTRLGMQDVVVGHEKFDQLHRIGAATDTPPGVTL
ncbi:MAG TPA: hypothetical protein VFO19_12830 [Vicinamibacterales bacterium]|jgi:hypothetical protein|nr:hypothetical protein [Vicinamibacterales bacterium]